MTIRFNDYEKVTADKNTLNYLALVFLEAGESYEAKGMYGLAKSAKENSSTIHQALKATGYYD